MNSIKHLAHLVYRFVVLWIVDVISLLATAWIIPGININPVDSRPMLVVAVSAAFLLGIVNLLVRPLILLLTLPLGFFVMFAIGFLINAIVLRITAGLLLGFEVTSWWTAFFGGFFLAVVNTIITTFLTIDDDDSFYEGLVERLAMRQAVMNSEDDNVGLVMLEIDGLSFWHIQKAIDEGWMPTLKEMIDQEGYKISRVDCGTPATTPACQAGILLGNNYDIPAFRWFDKDQNRLMVANNVAEEIEPHLSNGLGLVRDGSSIGNMFSGDAKKSILTFSKLRTGSEEDKKNRADDIYLLMINPYFFMRTLVLFSADVIQELWQAWRQKRQDVQPRLNRLHNGYPFLRAATNVFLRDVSAYLIILDIIRGVPAIYTTFAGYDEVAHHSGPWTQDAFKTLRQFDRTVARIRQVIEEKASRPYELLLLSDHGQSFGATFKQRYGMSIFEYIQSLLPHETVCCQTGGGDDGSLSVVAMMGELENIKECCVGSRAGMAVVNRTQSALQSNINRQPALQEVKPANVTVCHSGNLAQVYFDVFPRKVTLNELNAAYPSMVDMLVAHDGIGFVVAYDDDGEPLVFGENGARNLYTGDITGQDPLDPFGDVDLRAKQLKRVADFPHAGDLILNSTLYADGTVAAMEELIGNHGGLGGEQTDAFIFHPDEMEVPETTNSTDMFSILDTRRDIPAPPPRRIAESVEEEVMSWAISTFADGLSQDGTWLKRAA
ncbi:MAG: phage holin family protein, partial [Anaerolineales bacterium]|nr:phage holin family protein [Anaerolineales bacterium]